MFTLTESKFYETADKEGRYGYFFETISSKEKENLLKAKINIITSHSYSWIVGETYALTEIFLEEFYELGTG